VLVISELVIPFIDWFGPHSRHALGKFKFLQLMTAYNRLTIVSMAAMFIPHIILNKRMDRQRRP
jgi:hypothetical protein